MGVEADTGAPSARNSSDRDVRARQGWQVSDKEQDFRREMESRKDILLQSRIATNQPQILTPGTVSRIRSNIRHSFEAEAWFSGQLAVADHLVLGGEPLADELTPALTPTSTYSFVCPNCFGKLSQVGSSESGIIRWDYHQPDVISCSRCGQTYPDARFPETGQIECPRSGQIISLYLNDDERTHPEDTSGRWAYRWCGRPIHVSFSGIIRARKIGFAIQACGAAALVHAVTDEPAYAVAAIRLMNRLAARFPEWLYFDYWDAVADCDPLYAAWHDRDLPRAWKRHACAEAFEKDSDDRAAMLQGYWGAGRTTPSTGGVSALASLAEAYDILANARDEYSDDLWPADQREAVERDLLLEWAFEAEPFVGGAGKAECANNKAPRVYHAQAALGRALGLPDYLRTALRGYEVVRDESFGADGFSRETPSYNTMFLNQLLDVPELLEGAAIEEGGGDKTGKTSLFRTDDKLRLMLSAAVESLQGNGAPLPIGDTHHAEPGAQTGSRILETAANHYQGELGPAVSAIYRERELSVTPYGVIHLDLRSFPDGGARAAERRAIADARIEDLLSRTDEIEPPPPRAVRRRRGIDAALPEIFFPIWRTGILRHGQGSAASHLAMTLNAPGPHRHRDCLSLIYTDSGRPILGDLGYLSSTARVQPWFTRTESHSLVIVDGQEQQAEHAAREARVHMLVTSPRASVMEASCRPYPQCSEYRRLVILLKGPDARTIGVDVFRVSGGTNHTWRLFSEVGATDSPGGGLTFDGIDMPPEGEIVVPGDPDEETLGFENARQCAGGDAGWRALWKQQDTSYRLWMLSPVDTVRASHGPGQERWEEIGRRVRYVDAIREAAEGEDLRSTFVALHEPCSPDGRVPVRNVEVLPVGSDAGPNALVLRIECEWGSYLLFSEIDEEQEVDGIRFQGTFGVLGSGEGNGHSRRWLMSYGASAFHSKTFRARYRSRFGFENAKTHWAGPVRKHDSESIAASRTRPYPWPRLPREVGAHLLVETEDGTMPYPIKAVGRDRIIVQRFPLPRNVKRFELASIHYQDEP